MVFAAAAALAVAVFLVAMATAFAFVVAFATAAAVVTHRLQVFFGSFAHGNNFDGEIQVLAGEL